MSTINAEPEATVSPKSLSLSEETLPSPANNKGDTGFCSSFKSKRYRDKLRSEIKALETLLPVDRSVLHRKLDSQTVFRLVISYFRTKVFFKAAGMMEKPCEESDGNDSKEAHISMETCRGVEQGVTDLIKGDNLSQALDGFLLVAMTDGTILYTSESVLQYLGFNQVDLMHRCVYGIIHPDDYITVRDVMEQTIVDSSSCDHRADSFSEQIKGAEDRSEFVSFLCRMRCFNNTSAGYLKMHCSGRIQSLAGFPKSAKGSNQLLFALCRPFMISGQDLDYDVKQNVFWTKHDMDLTFKQLDKKAAEVIGYTTDDIDGDSFYKYIHPEDITTCCVCHKALTDSSEIQTMYFRIQKQAGGWVWLHSRGKVVTKNSKKYSIVFSHYPVREDDSSYIQQEIILRQRYSINELFCLRENNFHLDNPTSSDSMFEVICEQNSGKKSRTRSQPSPGTVHLEDVMTFPETCPSSWHVMSDRHSPVLPSTHAAHKITLREKQFQYQDFKKRQLQLNYNSTKGNTNGFVTQTSRGYVNNQYSLIQNIPSDEVITGQFRGQVDMYSKPQSSREASVLYSYPTSIRTNVAPRYPDGYITPELSPESYPEGYRLERTPCVRPVCSPKQLNHSLFCMPPSPPPSPQQHHSPRQQCMARDRTLRVRNVFTHHPSGGYTWVQDQTYLVRTCHPHEERTNSVQYISHNNAAVLNPQVSFKPAGRKRQMYGSELTQTSKKCFVTHHSTPVWEPTEHSNVPTKLEMVDVTQEPLPTEHQPSVMWQSADVQSCAVASGCCEPGDKTPQCFDPAFHMTIVEDPTGSSPKVDVDLPSIGSFLEYLNDI